MINKKLLLKVFIIFFITISAISISNISKATSGAASTSEPEGETLNLNILDDKFPDQFNPNGDGGEAISSPVIRVILPIVNTILGILQVFGAIIMVMCLAIAGFNGIISADEGLAEDLDLSIGNTVNEYGNELRGVVKPLNKGALTKIIRRAILGSFFLFMSATIVKIAFKIISGM